MSKFSDEDFMQATALEDKVHICLHRIKDYEMLVQIPMLARDDISIDYLEYLRLASEIQEAAFTERYDVHVQDDISGEEMDGSIGPLVLLGIYEGFMMLLAGHAYDAVPTSVIGSYGSMMVACARPFFYMLSGCDL